MHFWRCYLGVVYALKTLASTPLSQRVAPLSQRVAPLSQRVAPLSQRVILKPMVEQSRNQETRVPNRWLSGVETEAATVTRSST